MVSEASLNPVVIPGLATLHGETLGDPRVVVAVLDGAVDAPHPCFEGAKLTFRQTLASTRPTAHGTHVASVIFGQPGSPLKGIAPGCRGIVLPIFEETSDGKLLPSSQLDLARALRQAVDAGARVINVSGGQLTPSGKAQHFLADAVRYCAEKDVLIVAAAGNEGCECLHVPAALPSVLAVGAVAADGSPLDFSNWGEVYRGQGILAPGEGVMGAQPGGGVAPRTGTSYATPVVAGVAALLLSRQFARGGEMNPSAVRDALLHGAVACQPQGAAHCRRYLAGRLDLEGACLLLDEPAGAVEAAHRVPGEGSEADEPGTDIDHSQHGGLESLSDEMNTPIPEAPAACVMPQATVAPAAAPPAATDPNVAAPPVVAAPVAAAPKDAAPAVHVSNQVTASDCGCGGDDGAPCTCPGSLVFAIGGLGYDFGTEARRDSITQSMRGDSPNANVAEQVLAHLDENAWEAEALIWTLYLDGTAIYAIRPDGAFAQTAYERLREFLKGQVKPDESGTVERVSVPGRLAGKTRLLNGQVVPVIAPEVRGMYSWSTQALIDALKPSDIEGLHNFMNRIYYELRNLGLSPEERALNFAATNAYQNMEVFKQCKNENLELHKVEVEQNSICRPDSDCWDVKITFFNPSERLTVARRVFRYTVDISDVMPVTVGRVRSWAVY